MLFIIEHNYDIGNIIVGDLDHFFVEARARYGDSDKSS